MLTLAARLVGAGRAGLIALGGLVDGPGLTATFGARQRWTPPELLGQIFTTAASLKVGAFAIGAALAGPAVNTFGARGTICWPRRAVRRGRGRSAAARGPPQARPRAYPRTARLDLQQDDGVDGQRDREADRPAVEVALHERPAAERARHRRRRCRTRPTARCPCPSAGAPGRSARRRCRPGLPRGTCTRPEIVAAVGSRAPAWPASGRRASSET